MQAHEIDSRLQGEKLQLVRKVRDTRTKREKSRFSPVPNLEVKLSSGGSGYFGEFHARCGLSAPACSIISRAMKPSVHHALDTLENVDVRICTGYCDVRLAGDDGSHVREDSRREEF